MAGRLTPAARCSRWATAAARCDAIHLSVEFMHPIIEKRPPLPTISLTTDMAILTAIGNDQDFSLIYSQQLKLLGKAGDMALGVSTSGKSANINRALQAARETGDADDRLRRARMAAGCRRLCDFCFIVPSFSIPRIQETHETLLHIIWDLVHVIRGEEDVM